MIDISNSIKLNTEMQQSLRNDTSLPLGGDSFFDILNKHVTKGDPIINKQEENIIKNKDDRDDFYYFDDHRGNNEISKPVEDKNQFETIENKPADKNESVNDWEQPIVKDTNVNKLSNSKENNKTNIDPDSQKKELTDVGKKIKNQLLTGKLSKDKKQVVISESLKDSENIKGLADKKAELLKEIHAKKINRDSQSVADKEFMALASNLEALVKQLEKIVKSDADNKNELSKLNREIKDFKANNHDFAKLEAVFNKLKKIFDSVEQDGKAGLKINPYLLNIRELAAQLQKKLDNRHNGEPVNNSIMPSVKELNAQIEAMVQSQPKEQFEQSKDKHDSGNFSSVLKNESGAHKIFSEKTVQQRPIPFRDQLQSIIDNAKIYVKDRNNGTFSLRLHPQSLGSINVNLGLEQGILHGRFLVETNEARDLLLQNLNNMKDILDQAGIAVGDFQVNVQDRRKEFSDNNEMSDKKSFIAKQNEIMPELREYDAASLSYHNGSVNLVI